jgi:hypothetical protein
MIYNIQQILLILAHWIIEAIYKQEEAMIYDSSNMHVRFIEIWLMLKFYTTKVVLQNKALYKQNHIVFYL